MLEKLQFKCWKNSIKALTSAGLKCCFSSTMKCMIDRLVSRTRGGVLLFASSLAALWMSACSPQGPVPSAPAEYGAPDLVTGGLRGGDGAIHRNSIDSLLNKPDRSDSKPRRKAAEERPGLATGFGESARSPWNRQTFVRATPSKPAGTGVIYYNDKEGIEAMTGWKEKVSGMQTAAGEVIEWGIKGGMGFLPSYNTYGGGGRRFVVGKQGSNYSVVLKNRCKSRLEVVLSVDGLDVIDGKTAGYSKRGYVIAPGETLEVKGWRTGPDTVARFKFSSVAGSYANLRHGDHRNVGVIGLAVFTEKGVDPWTWMPREINERITADPFAKAP
jgi:hypothetical protein